MLYTIPVDTGLLTGMFDGAVRTLTSVFTPDQFKALVTPSGNEIVDGDILKMALAIHRVNYVRAPS